MTSDTLCIALRQSVIKSSTVLSSEQASNTASTVLRNEVDFSHLKMVRNANATIF